MTPPLPGESRDPKKVLIAIALNGKEAGMLRFETAFSFIKLACKDTGYEFEVIPMGGCDVCHARNLSMHHWRTRTNCGRLVWVDADVVFEWEHLVQLLSWDVPYIGGLYPLKDSHLRWSYNGWSRWSTKPGLEKLWEVKEICTGFTKIDWSLDVQLREAYPETAYEIEDPEYRGETGYELCAMGVIDRRRTPEDFYLCHRIRKLGHEIYADPSIQLDHVGSFKVLKWHKDKAGQARAALLKAGPR